MGVDRNWEKAVIFFFRITCFFSTAHEIILYGFCFYMNRKMVNLLHVYFYIVSETEKTKFITHVDIIEYMYFPALLIIHFVYMN